MIVLELALKGKPQQYRVIDEMICTAQFVRNKALRYWLDLRYKTAKLAIETLGLQPRLSRTALY